jgi:hypothetical protein
MRPHPVTLIAFFAETISQASGFPKLPNGLFFGGGGHALHQLGVELLGIASVRALVFVLSFATVTPPRDLPRTRSASGVSPQAPEARRGVNSSQVAEAWISPLTNLQPPSRSGGNMYVQRSQRTPGSGAGR